MPHSESSDRQKPVGFLRDPGVLCTLNEIQEAIVRSHLLESLVPLHEIEARNVADYPLGIVAEQLGLSDQDLYWLHRNWRSAPGGILTEHLFRQAFRESSDKPVEDEQVWSVLEETAKLVRAAA